MAAHTNCTTGRVFHCDDCVLVQVLERSRTKNCSLSWVKVTGGEVPDGAVKGGYNGEKKDIFICKVDIDNEK